MKNKEEKNIYHRDFANTLADIFDFTAEFIGFVFRAAVISGFLWMTF